MQTCFSRDVNDPVVAFYAYALRQLERAAIPCLVGGAFALTHYTKIERYTKDLDIFVMPEDCRRALTIFDAAGYATDLPFPHWLGKVHHGDHFIDIIFSSGNGVARVDDLWFERAVSAELFDVSVGLCPPEEMIWSKAFVQERERFDGADVMHLMLSCGPSLDWERLVMRFGENWRVLLAHLVNFGYVYPDRRDNVPQWVLDDLTRRLASERKEPDNRVCFGPYLSREQYLVDIGPLGYRDARTEPGGTMSREEADVWTAAIGDDKD